MYWFNTDSTADTELTSSLPMQWYWGNRAHGKCDGQVKVFYWTKPWLFPPRLCFNISTSCSLSLSLFLSHNLGLISQGTLHIFQDSEVAASFFSFLAFYIYSLVLSNVYLNLCSSVSSLEMFIWILVPVFHLLEMFIWMLVPVFHLLSPIAFFTVFLSWLWVVPCASVVAGLCVLCTLFSHGLLSITADDLYEKKTFYLMLDC